MDNELQTYLDTIAKNECFITEKVLKETPSESTEIVTRHNPDGSIDGPFIRKQIIAKDSLGLAYERIWHAQNGGIQLANIPHIFDFYEINEKRYVVMEYLPGKTLDELINSQVLSQEQIYSLFLEVCHAVTELHQKFTPAIIHRDLKPSNIMVSNGKAMLIDFGIARSFHQEAETDTQHFGTRAFAPPEQFGFSQTNQRSDEYALAALLFFCLSKRIPSSKDREQQFIDPLISAPVSTVLNKALALDPSARYDSVSDFAEALSEAIRAPKTAQPGLIVENNRATTYSQSSYPETSTQINSQKIPAPGTYVPEERTNPVASWKISEIRTFPTKPKKNPERFFALKVIWDVLVAFGVAIMLFGSVVATFDPVPTDYVAQLDLVPRGISYVLLFVGWVLPIGYLISIREPLLKLFKIQKKPSKLKEIGIAALLMFITGVLMTVIANTLI